MTLLPTNHPLGGGGFGLFGAPKFGKKRFPDFEQMPSPQMPQTNQPEKQDWMSGGKMTGRDAAGLALLAIGDAFGRKGSNNLGNMLQNRMAIQQQERMAQQQREQGWQDWQRKFDYTQANKAPDAPTPTALQRNYEYLRGARPDLADQYLESQAMAPPLVVPNADGTRTIYPAGSVPRGNTRPQIGAVEDGYRFKGGNPSDPNAWEEVGGAGGNVSSGFLNGL